MTRWYGSLQNRLEENRQFCDEIKVGTGVTEYSWSDREAYEVVEVIDQKHVGIRRLGHKCVGGAYSNDWELYSLPESPVIHLTKRGKYWYIEKKVTAEDIEDWDNLENDFKFWFAMNGFDLETVRKNGRQTKYTRMNVSFGHAEYYYDYSF